MNDEWQKAIERLTVTWMESPFGSFSEMLPVEPIKPTWKTKLANTLYHTVYVTAYYPLRWTYLTWDAIKEAFNDAWERWD